ncbi:MAG: hypothetical protein RL220_447 [Bacteroidota bacterium]
MQAMNHLSTGIIVLMFRKAVLIFLMLLSLNEGWAQNSPALERRISVHASNERVRSVFDDIEKKASCRFSYNTRIIADEKLVSVHADNRPVREILNMMFPDKYDYRERNGFLILTERKHNPRKLIISGYVEDADGEPIADATVYDPNSLVSANTNRYGYYEMRINRSSDPNLLLVNKSDFRDTLMPVEHSSSALRNITIEQDPLDSTLRHTLRDLSEGAMAGWYSFTRFILPENPQVVNIDDTIYRDFQFSFLPYLGTNRRLSGNVINRYSFNLIAGYSRGTTVAELGGFANIDRGDVSAVQVAGFANLVGGDVNGFQISGYGNLTAGNVYGAQIGGFANISGKRVDGVQAAGFSNISLGDVSGVQLAGFANLNLDTLSGVAASGFANVCLGSADGVLAAGFANAVLGNTNGAMLSGFANVTPADVDGIQIAGFANVARVVNGSQISGFFNYADSISGVPVAFMSFVRQNGYHKFELSADELFPFHIALRSGVHQFYNILQAGLDPYSLDDTTRWSFGYGIGTAPRLGKKLLLNIDVSTSQLVHGNEMDHLDLINRLDLGLEWQIAKGVAIAGGPSLNLGLRESNAYYPQSLTYHEPVGITSGEIGRLDSRVWLGWKVALRFF